MLGDEQSGTDNFLFAAALERESLTNGLFPLNQTHQLVIKSSIFQFRTPACP
jgi:hypothetical protein